MVGLQRGNAALQPKHTLKDSLKRFEKETNEKLQHGRVCHAHPTPSMFPTFFVGNLLGSFSSVLLQAFLCIQKEIIFSIFFNKNDKNAVPDDVTKWNVGRMKKELTHIVDWITAAQVRLDDIR